jgi:hypothetical protein
MLDREALIAKLLAVDRLASRTISHCKISRLAHELLDDPVEEGALVVQRLARLANAFFARAQRAKVLRRLGHNYACQLRSWISGGTRLGSLSLYSSKTMLPAAWPLMVMSKKTRGRRLGAVNYKVSKTGNGDLRIVGAYWFPKPFCDFRGVIASN